MARTKKVTAVETVSTNQLEDVEITATDSTPDTTNDIFVAPLLSVVQNDKLEDVTIAQVSEELTSIDESNPKFKKRLANISDMRVELGQAGVENSIIAKAYNLQDATTLGLEGINKELIGDALPDDSNVVSPSLTLDSRVDRDYTLFSITGKSTACYYGLELIDYDDIGNNAFKVRKYFVCTDFDKPGSELRPGHQHWKLFKDKNEYLNYAHQHKLLLAVDTVPYHDELWYQYKGMWKRRIFVTAANVSKTFDGKYRCNLIDVNLPEAVLINIYENGHIERVEQPIDGKIKEDILEYLVDWDK